MEKFAGGSIAVICGSMLTPGKREISELKRAVNEVYRLNDFSFCSPLCGSVRFLCVSSRQKPSHFKAFRRFSLESRGFPASVRMRAKSRFWKELRKERKELHAKGNTQAGSNTDKSILRCIAMKNIDWGKVPNELTMEQFYKLCHVSKKTARYLLRSGKIPCEYTGKRTHCYTIRKEDVIAFLQDREQYPEAYKAPPGWYSGGYDPRSHHDIPPIVLKDMHVYYEELLAKQPDVMTAKDVEALIGYAVSSVNNWSEWR